MTINNVRHKKLATTVVVYLDHRSSNYCLDILIMRTFSGFNIFRGAYL